ncbi:MAG: polysaccharide biosynthesis/export family protein [Weeksellaceae bacterium]
MKIKLKLLIQLFFLALLVSSCVSREKITYFQGDLEAVNELAERYEATIQPDDLLAITVYARDEAATRIFNQESNTTPTASAGNANLRRLSYLVDKEGYIEFPVLGRVKLGGMSRNEAIEYMKGLLTEEIIDPGVAINILNFRITVLGEVNNPGTFQLENEKITIMEALGKAQDLTINGERKNVLVIREVDGTRNYYRIDLTSNEVFDSPVYYLSQNDIVYVEPNQNKRNLSSPVIRDVSFVISIASFLLTLILLITR